MTVESGSTVFRVPQQQRAPSAQLKSSASNAHNRLKLAAKPQQKLLPGMCLGEIVRRYFNYLLIN